MDEIEQDLIRQFKIAIAAIAKVYDEAMGESAKGNLMKREKGNIMGNPKKEDKEQTALTLAARFVLSCMYFGKKFVKIADVNGDFFPDEGHKKVISY